MQITTTEMKRCILIAPVGRIDGATAPELEQALKTLLATNHFRLVIDMGNVTFLSSAGLRVLVSTWKATRRFNRGDLRLANVPERINSVFELTGLHAHFAQFQNTVEAVGSF